MAASRSGLRPLISSRSLAFAMSWAVQSGRPRPRRRLDPADAGQHPLKYVLHNVILGEGRTVPPRIFLLPCPDQVGGGGRAEHADADAGDDPADDPARNRGPAQEQQSRRHVDADRDEQDSPPPEPVRHVADQEQARGHAQRVHREDDRDQQRAEVIPRLVQDIQRRRHGRERHRDGEHVAGQPEPGPVPLAATRGSRRRNGPHLSPLVSDFPRRRRGHVNLPDRNCSLSRFGAYWSSTPTKIFAHQHLHMR